MLMDISKEELVEILKQAALEAAQQHPLSPEEVEWVRMAIKAEADRAKLRKAIIEKSLAGLVWAGLASGGMYIINLVSEHWK
jgi:hypothetical protein